MTNKKTNLKLLVVTLATFGLATSAWAQSPNVAVPNPASPASWGLLGSTYVSLTGNYVDLKGGPPGHARGWSFDYNQPLAPGYDLTIGYNWVRARAFGLKATDQSFDAALTAYFKQDWGKPFVQAGGGYDWVRADFAPNDHSYLVFGGVGAEFLVAPTFVITPYVNFARQTGYNQNEFDYGTKASLRITREWSVTAKVQYDDLRHAANQTEYSLGVNYHF